MCNPVIFMVAGAAISAMGAINQGEQAAAMGNYQKAQAEADAEATKGAAELQARQIRDAGKRQKAAAVAAQAASGVSISDGTAELINNEIDQGSEQDALSTILAGKNGARRTQAQGEFAQISGNNARSAGYVSAIGSGFKAYSGWKTPANSLMDPTEIPMQPGGGR